MPPQKRVWLPKAMGVTLYGKMDFADVIKLKFLRCGDYTGLSIWVWFNHKNPYKLDAGGQSE